MQAQIDSLERVVAHHCETIKTQNVTIHTRSETIAKLAMKESVPDQQQCEHLQHEQQPKLQQEATPAIQQAAEDVFQKPRRTAKTAKPAEPHPVETSNTYEALSNDNTEERPPPQQSYNYGYEGTKPQKKYAALFGDSILDRLRTGAMNKTLEKGYAKHFAHSGAPMRHMGAYVKPELEENKQAVILVHAWDK